MYFRFQWLIVISPFLDTCEEMILDPNAQLSTRPISLREIETRVQQQKEDSILECVDYSN